MESYLKDLEVMHNCTIYPDDEIVNHPTIGELYHLSWAQSRGMVWKLIDFNGDKALMETPKTKKRLTTKLATLRHTNRSIVQKAKRREKRRIKRKK